METKGSGCPLTLTAYTQEGRCLGVCRLHFFYLGLLFVVREVAQALVSEVEQNLQVNEFCSAGPTM